MIMVWSKRAASAVQVRSETKESRYSSSAAFKRTTSNASQPDAAPLGHLHGIQPFLAGAPDAADVLRHLYSAWQSHPVGE